jgi:hypothetical protein
MPIRRPNLLDAFRRTPGAAGPPGSAPSAPASTPAPAPAPARPAVEPARTLAPAARSGLPLRERVLLVALGLAIVTLVAVLAFRRGGGEPAGAVSAAPPAPQAQPAPPARAEATPPPPAAAPQRTKQDQELYDPKNRYTVRLIQYQDDANGLALAKDAYRWLAKFGYPVASPVQLAGGRGLVLVAGARPTKEELVPLRDNLRQVRYPENSKSKPFADAYIGEIDSLVAR